MLQAFLALSLLVPPIASDRYVDARGGVEVSEPFEAVAFTWSGGPDLRASIRVRASADGSSWTEWVNIPLDDDISIPSEGRYATAIHHFGWPQRFVEHDFRGRVVAPRITIFAPAPDDNLPRLSSTSGIRSRTEWGCPDGQGSRWTPAYSNVTHAIVHHTAGSNGLTNWEAEVRNIWQFHTVTNGWGDIGYNFLIDPNGVVYEGRAGGDGAIGAHFSCRNTNTVGVALLGTYSTEAPSDAAMTSLEWLLRELMRRHAIAPDAVALHVPSGLELQGLSAHRDGNSSPVTCTRTECPGSVLYELLPALRQQLACVPAGIERHPESASIAAGGSATLSVMASGNGPHSYQWYRGPSSNADDPVEGANEAALTVWPARPESYWVRVSNACGTSDSSAAIVSIAVPGRRRVVKP